MASAAVLLSVLCSSATALPVGWQHTYRGEITAQRGDNPPQTFELAVVVAPQGHFWRVSQSTPSWPWSSTFGRLEGGASGPSVLARHEEGVGVVELTGAEFDAPAPLAAGQKWEAGGRSYEVLQDGARLRVQSSDTYGTDELARVESDHPLIYSLMREFVLGRGHRHQLKMTLSESKQLTPAELELATGQFEHLLKLRERLGRPARVRENQWTKAQLDILKEQLPDPDGAAASLRPTLIAAAQDAQVQRTRVGALGALEKSIIGKPLKFRLKNVALGGKELTSDSLLGKVVVLHFWSYKDQPLEEPYGQAAYLDFLARRLDAEKAVIVGVPVLAADEDPTVDAQARAARQARKFREFMNLSYPIAADGGDLLKAAGDPRRTGAELPLFLVLDGEGRVVHYHAGHYKVDRDRGLVELEAEVKKASKP